MAASVFKEKVVVITGASSGIERELVYQLAAQGAWLALAARNTERLAGVRTECQGRGGKAVAISTDVSESAQCAALIQRTVEHYSRLDVLVKNAGRRMMAQGTAPKTYAPAPCQGLRVSQQQKVSLSSRGSDEVATRREARDLASAPRRQNSNSLGC